MAAGPIAADRVTVERRLCIAVAVVAAIAGVALRAWHLFAEPLWLDEAYSAFAADHDLAFLWRIVPRYETHPPFYYALLHIWVRAFGDGLVALRLPGLLAGLATPPLVALVAARAAALLRWRAGERCRVATAAFALACLSIPLVEMTRQVRPYPLMILAEALALIALLAMARRREAGQPVAGRALAGYLLLAEAMLWLHSLGPFWAASLAAALLAAAVGRRARGDLPWLVLGAVALLAAWAPALLVLRAQAPTWVASTWLTFSWPNFWRRLATLYAVPGWQAASAAVAALPAIAALIRAGDGGRRLLAMLVALALLPVVLAVAVSLTIAPVFLARTLSPVAVPAIVLLALGARRWPGAAAVAVLAANLLAVGIQARAAGPMQDWYGAIDWLRPRRGAHDLILAYPNEGALPLGRALGDRGLVWPIRPVPAPVPALDVPDASYPTGNRGAVSLPPARLRAIAASLDAVPTVWLLRLGAGGYDRGDAFLRILAERRSPVARYRDGAIDIVGLVRPPPAPARNRR